MPKLPENMCRRRGRRAYYFRRRIEGKDRWVSLGANFEEALNTILVRYYHIKETGIAGDGAIGTYGILAASRDLDHVIIYGQ